uniref:DUF1758 domain-containing protein n=1 Tax=Bursaphelenchus xylophilus TaxID=6326 RepID=A0A1I7SIA4_BURXY
MVNDKHPKDKVVSADESKVIYGNIPPNLVLPYPCGPIFPGALAADFVDCEEETLEPLSNLFNVEHLSECTNPELFKYPITGIVDGVGGRFVIPLKVRAVNNSQNFVVYFVLDSGAPLISFSKRTADKIFGDKMCNRAIVQDIHVTCRLSGSFNDAMKNVNLLGSQFLLKSNTSIIISPNEFDYLSYKMRIFYLTTFSTIGQVQTMAASRHQDPDITKKLEVHSVKKRQDNLTDMFTNLGGDQLDVKMED